MSQDTSDLLEKCLKQVAAGATIDEAVAPYPEQAAELRELLEIAVLASKAPTRRIHVPASAQVDSRQRFLAQAEQLQHQRGSTYWWGLLGFLRANVGSLSFGVGILLLFFLAIGSVRALPGDRLYPVKLAAEQAGASLPGSPTEREQRAITYENQRTAEVAQMIQLKRTGPVSFGGFLQNDPTSKDWQIDSIPLQLSQSLEKQAARLANARVEVKGYLDEQGSVKVETLQPHLDALEGILTRVDAGVWMVGSQEVRITELTQVTGEPKTGSRVAMQVTALKDSSAVLGIQAEVLPAGGTQETPSSPANTLPAQPVGQPQRLLTSEPEDPVTPTLTPAQGNKTRPITQPALNLTPTPGAASSSGKDTPSTESSESHSPESGSKESEH